MARHFLCKIGSFCFEAHESIAAFSLVKLFKRYILSHMFNSKCSLSYFEETYPRPGLVCYKIEQLSLHQFVCIMTRLFQTSSLLSHF